MAAQGRALGHKVPGAVAGIATPDTILRWYRRLIAKKYNGSMNTRPGRPCTGQDIAALVVKMANGNPRWGYTRIRGAMRNLGHEIGRSPVKRILKEAGVEPAPKRAIACGRLAASSRRGPG